MTKARQRDHKRRHQQAVLDRIDHGLMVRIIDALFRELAEKMALQNVSIEEAVEASWRLFEHGLLRLVSEGESWGVGACGDICPRAQAKKNRPVVEWRRALHRPDAELQQGAIPAAEPATLH
jgi:hypothetical protein